MATPGPGTLLLAKSEYERIKKLAETKIAPRVSKGAAGRIKPVKSKAETEANNRIIENRKAKLAAREKRLAAKEEEHLRRDKEYEEMEAVKRQAMIDSAKAMLYQNNDAVKGLRQADFLAEILREREAQSNFRGEREKVFEQQDRAKDEARIEAAALEIQAELEKQAEMRKDASTTAGTQLEQAAMKRALRKAQRQAELAEQAAYVEDAKIYEGEERKKTEQARQTMMRFTSDRANDIADANRRKAEYRKLIAEEEKRNAKFAEEKERQSSEWKERMLKVRQDKIAARARLAESLKIGADNRDAEENALIQKIMEQKWAAEDAAEVKKAMARQAAQKGCKDHMFQVIDQKAKARLAAREAEVARKNEIEAAGKAEIEEELAKQTRIFNENLAVSKSRLEAAAERRAQAEAERKDLEDYRLQMEADAKAEQEALIAYAEARRAAAIARGVTNTYPLDKAVATVKPKAPKPMPNLPSMTTRRRGNPYPGDTKKRIGFIY